jgi:hypothetical protein
MLIVAVSPHRLADLHLGQGAMRPAGGGVHARAVRIGGAGGIWLLSAVSGSSCASL